MPLETAGVQIAYQAYVGAAQAAVSRHYSLHDAIPTSGDAHELTGGSYARIARAASEMDGTDGSGDNDAALTWANLQTEPVRVGVYTAATGGTRLGYSNTNLNLTGFSAGDGLNIPAGSLDIMFPTGSVSLFDYSQLSNDELHRLNSLDYSQLSEDDHKFLNHVSRKAMTG